MFITKDFVKALNGLLIVTIAMFGISIWMSIEGLRGYLISEPNPTSRVLLNMGISLIWTSAFWFAVYYVSKEKIGALVGFLLSLASTLPNQVKFLMNDVVHEYSTLSWWGFLLPILPYIAFGIIHFKSSRGVYMVASYCVIAAIGYTSASEYYGFMNRMLDFIGLEGIFELEIPLEGTSYRPVNLFEELIYQRFQLLSFTIFWFVFSSIKNARIFDLSLRTIFTGPKLNVLTFSIIYWVLTLTLIIEVFGAVKHFSYFDMSFNYVFKLVSFCFGIFVISSFYRNFIPYFLSSRGYNIGWVYLLLNIPIVQFFTWLSVILFMPAKESTTSTNENDTSEKEENVLKNTRLLQAEFVKGDKNKSIKMVIIVLMILRLVVQLLQGNPGRQIGFQGDPVMAYLALFVSSIISLGLIIWYFSDKKAIFILFAIQAFLVIVSGLTRAEPLIAIVSISGLINVVTYYVLFHFDQMKFVQVNEEPSV